MATVTIEMPDETFPMLQRSPREVAREMRLAAALLWYTQGRISHEKAAQFAGVSRITFIDALAAAQLPAFHVDIEELYEEVESALQAHRERLAAGVPGAGGSAGRAEGNKP